MQLVDPTAIPLTDAFFQANGWEMESSEYYRRYTKIVHVEKERRRSKGKRTLSVIFINTPSGEDIIASIRGRSERQFYGRISYVDELLQALRLCQHHEVADALHFD